GFPCVIKAPDRQGQRGLTLVRAAEDVADAVRVALDASRTATLLVEEHIPGLEVTVNAFSAGGHFHPLTVTDRLTAPPPAFGVALAAALGEESPSTSLAPVARVGGACVRFLVAPRGELREVTGIEEAFAQEGIRGIRIYRRPGHRFEDFRRGADRAGAILAVG